MCTVKIFGLSLCQQVFQGNKSLIIQFDSTNQSSSKSHIKWDSAKNSIVETQKICSYIILMRDKETEKLTIFQNCDYLKEILWCNTHFNDCLDENLITEPKQRMTKDITIYDKIQSFLLKDETENYGLASFIQAWG